MSPPLPKITLLDGGLGTTLVDRHSYTFSPTKPLWSSHLLLSSSDRSTLLSAQKEFAAAGADVILTATYQASFSGFSASGIRDEKEAGRVMRNAVSIARSAFEDRGEGGKGKVALSLGAYGATMVPGQEYSGCYDREHCSIERLREWHFERVSAFLPLRNSERGKEEEEETRSCWGCVGILAFETLPRVEEVWAVRQVVRLIDERVGGDKGGKKDFWIACVFPGEGNVLPDGSSVREVVHAMLGDGKREEIGVEGMGREARPMGIGINCTRIGKVEGLVLEFEREVKALMESGGCEREWPALVLYPDGTRGEVYDTSTKEWVKKGEDDSKIPWDEEIFEIVKRARERRLWKDMFVGGCCKTTPDDIAKLRKRIDEL